MHHQTVSVNYPWLPHNTNASFDMPPEYLGMPLQPLGDRQKFYNELVQVCEEHFNKHFNRGERCRQGESQRIEMTLRQPRSMQNFTRMGFEKIRAPEKVFSLIKEFWEANKQYTKTEEWGVGDMLTNHWQVPTHMVSVVRPDLQGGGEYLRQQIWDSARETIQHWTGQQLQPSSVYGIRIYYGNAILAPHVDRLPLVSSAIINVDQDVDEPWPLEVIGHDGRAHNITMKPGDMVLYESHSIIHGRPFPLKGRFVANIFIHFEPVDDSTRSRSEGSTKEKYQSPVVAKEVLPKYILPDSPEAEQLAIKAWNGGPRGALTESVHYAARSNNLAALQQIIDQEQQLIHARDENGWTPLHEAARYGYMDVVKYLVNKGADVNARSRNFDGASVLWWAVAYVGENHPVVAFLESHGAVVLEAEK